MKYILRKIGAISLVMISLGMMPLYAAEEKPVLKLEDAIASGFTYSDQMSLNSQEIDLAKERLKANQGESYVTYQTIYLQKAKSEQQTEILKDKITYDITSRYNVIMLLEKEIDMLEHNILLTTRELNHMKLKQENGLVDNMQYENMAISLQDLKDTRQAKIESLNNKMSFFKLVTGKDLTKYTLEESHSYEVFHIPGSIDRYMERKIEDYLKWDNDLAQFAKNNILTDAVSTMYYSDYLNKEYNADKNITSLENSKKSMKQSLMNSYSSLLDVEEQIGSLKTKQRLAQKQAEYAKLKYDAGMITELEYQQQIFSLKGIEFNLTTIITNYNALKLVIDKPWSASA